MQIKKIFLAATMLLLGHHAALAQYDTLQRSPILYCYNWEGIGWYHGDTLCIVRTGLGGRATEESFKIRWWSQRDNVDAFALYQHSDTVLHAIGIGYGTTEPYANEFYLQLYDSTMSPIKELTVTDMDISSYDFYLPGGDYHTRKVFFAFFDGPIDVYGDFYIGESKYLHGSTSRFHTMGMTIDHHEPPYHIGRYPAKVYLDDIKAWVDDTLEHELRPYFLLVMPDCRGAENITVATDSAGCVNVEWDSLRWKTRWVLRLDGPDGTRYDTVGTNFHTYCNLDANAYYELSIQSQCYRPSRGYQCSQVWPSYIPEWSPWSDPISIGNGSAAIGDIGNPNPTIELFPNPAGTQVQISSTLPMTRIEVSDALGRVVGTFQPPRESSFSLDVSSWSEGVYLLRIHTDDGITAKKLLIH